MSELAQLIAQKFVARADVKAVQRANGEYMPHRLRPDANEFVPLTLDSIDEHLAGTATYGHYCINTKNRCKLFTLDIDLEEKGLLPPIPDTTEWASVEDYAAWLEMMEPCNPREVWKNRADPRRGVLKTQMRLVANDLMRFIYENMELPTACAYSGNKGIHVYGFTGAITAHDARMGGEIVMESLGFTPALLANGTRRASTFVSPKYWNFAVEVYPKQDQLSGAGFGNLVRLPLGRNLKSPKDPVFFVDMTAPLNELKPVDPIWALTEGAVNPWKRQGE